MRSAYRCNAASTLTGPAIGGKRKTPVHRRLLRVLLASTLVLPAHSLWAQKSEPTVLPEAPKSQIESPPKLFRISYHFNLINTHTPLDLQQPTGTGELLGAAKHFAGSSSGQWLSAGGKVYYPTIRTADPLQYVQRISWANAAVRRVSQQAKAHPHVANVVKILQPPF